MVDLFYMLVVLFASYWLYVSLSAHIEILTLLIQSQPGAVNNIHGKALNALQHSLWASSPLSPSFFMVSHTNHARKYLLINV